MRFIHDQAIAIVPSVLNPVFETVTGEVPSFLQFISQAG